MRTLLVLLFLSIFCSFYTTSISCPLNGNEQPAEAPVCCFCFDKPNDICGSCKTKAMKGTWCATSEDYCKQCGGSWCASSSPASALADPVAGSPSPSVAPVPANSPATVSDPSPDSPPANASAPAPVPSPTTANSTVQEPAPALVSTPVEQPATPKEDNVAHGDDDVPPMSQTGNPFEGHELYVNPTFKANIKKTIKSATPGAEKDNLIAMSKVASAYWLDVKAKVQPDDENTTETAAGVLKDAASMATPPLVTFIVYDLPNRDCNAKASNGEICCGAKLPAGNCNYLDAASSGTCDDGLAEYKNEYIDKLAVSVKKYCRKVPMVLVIEPDSIPNLVTNMDEPKCGSLATKTAYRTGIKYAIQTLHAACPQATQYLDGAHGGWLGWPDNLEKFVAEVKDLGISKYLRGFSLNVANYQPLGIMCPSIGFCIAGKNSEHECCKDPCGLSMEYNSGHSELNYAAALSDAMKNGMPEFSSKFIIDTGRNAKSPRDSCAHWCNARGAGAGVRPTTKTAAPELVDAYHWLKTPGESDGCTNVLPDGKKCARFDASCASDDSIGSKPGEPRCPEAGRWSVYIAKMLANNAAL